MGSHVKVESRGELALVHLDRPPANALNPEVLRELEEVRVELAADLRGVCDPHFLVEETHHQGDVLAFKPDAPLFE